ncbi:MAG: carbon-nitrogen hydrolase family protein [Planctomycetes bacterium]|nr:carbon-nitrogen hydrolase family protein [Planctomycetota bacterium]
MLVYVGLAAGALAAVAALAADAAGAAAPPDLVRNGDFAAGEGDAAADWVVWKPAWDHAACAVRRTDAGLLVESPDEPCGVGGAWQKIVGVEGGKAYAVEASCEVRGGAPPLRTAQVRVEWRVGGKPEHPAGWLVRLKGVEGGLAAFEDVLVAPDGADGARLTLEVKWPQGGAVVWKRVAMRPAPLPPPRKVRIGTVYLRPKDSTPEKNLALAIEQIDAAGRLGLDVVCLSEAILQVGTAATLEELAKPIPGPDTERLGAAARRNRLWVVAGLAERAGPRVYNTAVLLDREGRVAGTYRKVHLPREEWTKGVTPGGEYPVFKTDFGTVAIQICYDWFFPEVAESFALRGAEVLFAPTWGTTFPDQDGRAEGETVFRVRARDNGLVVVPSVYDGQSMVIDPLGRILAASAGKEGVFWAEVDLGRREPLFWVGHWRTVGPRHRMPETYGPLTAP